MKNHSDDSFTFDFIGVIFLVMAASMVIAILVSNPPKVANLLVPAVFCGVGLIILVGN
jgi:hypothetical protein